MVSHTIALFRTTVAVVVVALLANGACVQPSLAQASPDLGEVPTVTVKYSDLDLASVAGSRALYGRLVAAAEQVCPRASDSLLELQINRAAHECIQAAVDRAVRQIHHPRFAAVAAEAQKR
jgi:UrcA family protein